MFIIAIRLRKRRAPPLTLPPIDVAYAYGAMLSQMLERDLRASCHALCLPARYD